MEEIIMFTLQIIHLVTNRILSIVCLAPGDLPLGWSLVPFLAFSSVTKDNEMKERKVNKNFHNHTTTERAVVIILIGVQVGNLTSLWSALVRTLPYASLP